MQQQIVDLYLDKTRKLSYKKIAAEVGIATGTVGSVLTKLNIPRRRPRTEMPKISADANKKSVWKGGFNQPGMTVKVKGVSLGTARKNAMNFEARIRFQNYE